MEDWWNQSQLFPRKMFVILKKRWNKSWKVLFFDRSWKSLIRLTATSLTGAIWQECLLRRKLFIGSSQILTDHNLSSLVAKLTSESAMLRSADNDNRALDESQNSFRVKQKEIRKLILNFAEMNSFKVQFLIYLTLSTFQVQCFSIHTRESKVQRTVRGIKDWKIFAKPSTEAPQPTTTTVKPQNNLEIGQCEEDDKVSWVWRQFKSFQHVSDLQIIYIDDTRLEANNSTLGGVIEIHIDSPYYITCTKIFDQMASGTGAMPSYNSGGQGQKFIFINVQGQYGYGVHFRIVVRGNLKKSESEGKSSES